MTAIFKLIAWGWRREPRLSRALGIAGIHATVLTILIGITSAASRTADPGRAG